MKRFARMAASIVLFCLALFFLAHADLIGMMASMVLATGAWPNSSAGVKSE